MGIREVIAENRISLDLIIVKRLLISQMIALYDPS
ncbi:hypothetical protein RSOCI_01555 [Rhabdochlamydiaceae symbiont of Dictyostelium giganteum]